ncbi:MAG: hypothetical protein ACRD0W_05675 [Acidimicrobiales bacterium]
MPTEKVYSPHSDGHAVVVQWGRDQDVRIGTRPEDKPGEGFFLELDRGGCNALIRVLRKARDQAHGRDE